ncbi:MAG: EAL domain-containing protein [Coriobacteriales bacterium]|nr:EAL domain-containing protein [Coriobacteriales bacterium]
MEKYAFSSEEQAVMERSRMPFAIYQFIDKRVCTLVLSDGFCSLFGYEDRAQAYYDMDHDMYRDTHPDDVARIANAAFAFATQGGTYEAIYRTKDKDGSGYKIVHAMGEHVYTGTGVRLAHVWYTDEGSYVENAVTHKSKLNQQLNHALHEESILQASYYDYLTGLPSMTYFFELAEAGIQAIRRAGGRPAILYTDFCGMKFFNRKHGFAEGDALLKAFSKELASQFSNENCSRFGRDNFAVFCEASELDMRLSGLLDRCRLINHGKNLPVRVGVYLGEDDAVTMSTACDRAKYACDATRNVYASRVTYYDQGMQKDAESHQYIIDNLDRALEQEWVKVYYQPIVRAASGKVCDEEALARWIDPQRGFLSPAEFIPILEESKLIYKLDLYVVDHVLQKMRDQQALGLHLDSQSVNLSRADFEACDIVEEIRERVDRAGIARNMLNIEITESAIASDFHFMRKQIERFRSLGFNVWMDDFGSGYSSLDVLNSLHFDLIKFDMHFLRRFDEGDKGKIILTELIKMALGLGIDTICEGVEREDQAKFLMEVGCSKLQGFYYCKPISLEQIVERNRQGIQIGYENPAESGYYGTLGSVNLYDLSAVARDDVSGLDNYFNTLPTAILELQDDRACYVRYNKSYEEFVQRAFGQGAVINGIDYGDTQAQYGSEFVKALLRCAHDGNRVLVDERISATSKVHSLLRRLAVNPVTGTVAIAVAVLAVTEDDPALGTTYAHIANALAADYFSLYYVDMEDDDFIEYASDASRQSLAAVRRGRDFFGTAVREAQWHIYEADRVSFAHAFSKRRVAKALNTQGTFTLTYRLIMDGKPKYVNLKAISMGPDDSHIVIGVSNVDGQMRHQEALERLQRERASFARINALSDDFICIYTVDPVTERYTECSSTLEYDKLGLLKEGERFFEESRQNGLTAIFEEDLPLFCERFTLENVLRDIERDGMYVLRYRLLINSMPTPVCLKAAIIEEQGERRIIMGVILEEHRLFSR